MDKIYFEDLEEGQVFTGDACRVDRQEALDYARENDPQPYHVDEDAAKQSLYGGLIASAGYTITLWYRSLKPVLARWAFLGGFEWHIRFPRPVLLNDTLVDRVTIKSKKASSKGGRGYVNVWHEMTNQQGELVFTADCTLIFATRDH